MKSKTITYSRKPTAAEIKFGHGARHYKDFPYWQCVADGKHYGIPVKLKKRIKCKVDGLIYTR